MEKLLSELPPDAARLMRDLLAEDQIPIEQLRTELAEHLAQLKDHTATHEFIDLDMASLLNSVCHRLLDRLTDASPAEYRLMVQAAVRYFILDEDADSDLQSPIGFDDDAQVVQAVAAAVGAPDLISGLP